jgi:hypothetical protein
MFTRIRSIYPHQDLTQINSTNLKLNKTLIHNISYFDNFKEMLNSKNPKSQSIQNLNFKNEIKHNFILEYKILTQIKILSNSSK